jgi:hypothetical protein
MISTKTKHMLVGKTTKKRFPYLKKRVAQLSFDFEDVPTVIASQVTSANRQCYDRILQLDSRPVDESEYPHKSADLDMTESTRKHIAFRKGKDPKQFEQGCSAHTLAMNGYSQDFIKMEDDFNAYTTMMMKAQSDSDH